METKNENQEFPEAEKMYAVRVDSAILSEFIDWLLNDECIVLAKYADVQGFRDSLLMPVQKTVEEILAEYFQIDLKKLEVERKTMLEKMRAGRVDNSEMINILNVQAVKGDVDNHTQLQGSGGE